MPVMDRTRPEVEIPAPGGGSPPPGNAKDDSGRYPENDRGRLMLLIYNARGPGAVSLEYLRGCTGFSRTRLWRAFEDLEDMGYVEPFEGDPRGPLSRWLDGRKGKNEWVFASTFVVLTETGRHSPELEAYIAANGGTRRGRLRLAGGHVSVRGGMRKIVRILSTLRPRKLPAKISVALAREWRIAGDNDAGDRRALARLILVASGLGAVYLAGIAAIVLSFTVFG